jgi:predicted RNA binding protein YcfA (HicA-like mRNA interferase family)
MRYAELIRRLRKLGCKFYRQGKGSHEVWWNPETGRRAIITHHTQREIPPGTLNDILKDLGIDPNVFWGRPK